MFKYFIIVIAILLIISVVFSISFSDAYDLINSNLNNLNSVIQKVNGIFGIDSFRVNSAVSLLDPNNSAPLGYYEFQGEQESVSDYLVNTRLSSNIGIYNKVAYIYPNIYTITLHVFGRSAETYGECIRVVYQSSIGDELEVLYCYSGFMATINTYYNIEVPTSMGFGRFLNSAGIGGYFYSTDFYETNVIVRDFVQNTLID